MIGNLGVKAKEKTEGVEVIIKGFSLLEIVSLVLTRRERSPTWRDEPYL